MVVGVVVTLTSICGVLYGLGSILRRGMVAPAAQRIPGRPINFAHRGDSSHAPENTMEAFALGVEGGAGGLEMDAHITADGEVVIIHDDTVDRTSDGSGFVADMTLEELNKWDAGYAFTTDGREFPYRGKGVTFSTLAEVYEAFPEAWVNVEIKSKSPEAPQRMFEVIRAASAEGRTVVAASDHTTMKKFRKVSARRVATSASVREIYVFYFASRLGFEYLIPIEYVALQVPPRTEKCEVVTPRFMAAAKARGIAVDVWTVNDEREMRRLLELGVDTIMTDMPGALDGVLREHSGG